MQLVYFSVIISALLCRQISISLNHRFSEIEWQRGLVFAVVIIVSSIIARIHSERRFRVTSKSKNLHERIDEASQVFHRYRMALQWFCIFGTIVVLPQSGWLEFVNRSVVGRGWMSLDFLVCLLPSMLVFAWIETCAFAVEMRIEWLVKGFSAGKHRDKFGLFRHLWRSAKHTWLFVLPFALFSCTMFDVVQLVVPEWNELHKAAIVGFLSIGGAVVLAPYVLARVWNAVPLEPGNETQEIFSIWQAAGMGNFPILTWSTQGRVANALVIGILPSSRKLLLSDRLLKVLSPAEIKMIVLHEAAHVRRRHALIRGLPMLIAFVGMILIAWFVDQAPTTRDQSVLGIALVATVACLLLMIVSIGVIARWSEYDADREAIELASRLGDGCSPYATKDSVQAARDLVSALRTICPAGDEYRRNWLHPSIASRIAMIEQRSFATNMPVAVVASR